MPENNLHSKQEDLPNTPTLTTLEGGFTIHSYIIDKLDEVYRISDWVKVIDHLIISLYKILRYFELHILTINCQLFLKEISFNFCIYK